MIGIYKITNKINGMVYVGQSVHIKRRFQEHIKKSSNSQKIDQAINEFGKEAFNFEIIEECQKTELDAKENYWIQYYNSIYPNGYNIVENNITIHTLYRTNKIDVENIQKDLIVTNLSLKDIANKYNVSISTVSRINNGQVYKDEKNIYPLRQIYQKHQEYFCIDCGQKISYGSIRCNKCAGLFKRTNVPISRNELKNLIRNESFSAIGRKYNVTDNAIRKWCDKYFLPRQKSIIKKYSDQEWENL